MSIRVPRYDKKYEVSGPRVQTWESPMEYEAAVLKWASTLDESALRSLAYDYRAGDPDPACRDAQRELERRRAANRLRRASIENRCEVHQFQRGRAPQSCPGCARARGEQPANPQVDLPEALRAVSS